MSELPAIQPRNWDYARYVDTRCAQGSGRHEESRADVPIQQFEGETQQQQQLMVDEHHHSSNHLHVHYWGYVNVQQVVPVYLGSF